jgi:uncharacterized protein (DUF736 family)
MPKSEVKYWISMFDNKEKHDQDNKQPRFNIVINNPDNEHDKLEGGVWPKQAKSGNWYLSGSLKEPFQKPNSGGRSNSSQNDDDCPF